MGRKGKIGLLIGAGVAVAALCVFVIINSVISSTKTDIAAQIEAMPRFDAQKFCQEAAVRYGQTYPVSIPSVPAAAVTAEAQKLAEGRVERIFPKAAVDRAIKERSAAVKTVRNGQNVSFKLKAGATVEGKLKSVVKEGTETKVTVGTTAYKMHEQIDPAYYPLFSASEADRARLKVSAELRREYEQKKTGALSRILSEIEPQMMSKALYCKDGSRWVATAEKINQERMAAAQAFQREREAQINRILDENTVFGHRFDIAEFDGARP